MLYRKTTTAFSAVILGVMALLGATAHAQIDLDKAGTREDPIAVVTFSKESLPILSGTETFYDVRVGSASQNDLALLTTLGYPVPAETGTSSGDLAGLGGVAVRFDLQNVEFDTPMPGTLMALQTSAGVAIDASAAPRRLAYGGTGMARGSNPACPGDTCAIYEIATTAGTDLLADTRIYLILWDGRIRVSPNGDGQFRARVYRSADAALEAGTGGGSTITGLRKDTGFKRGVHVASSMATIVCPGTITATGACAAPRIAYSDVAATPRWTNFAPPGTKVLGTIGNFLSTGHWKADGTARVATLSDVRPVNNGGTIVLEDDTENLDFASFTVQSSDACDANLRDPAIARDVGVTVATEGDNLGKGTKSLFAGYRHLCASPKANTVIPRTSIRAMVSFNALPNSAFAAAGGSGTVGIIRRNGAQAELSYLTVSDRYNQRIIITNRSGQDAEYGLDGFYTEDGTEGAAGEMASGTVPAEGSIVITTRDAVTFTGSRARGSASLSVTAPAGMVSVATTQVNLSDGSTDTINYDVAGAN